jgi:signal peptidase I
VNIRPWHPHRLCMPAIAAGTAVPLLIAWARRHLLLVTVEGPSMHPTLQPGNRALVRRTPPTAARPGDIVVIKGDTPVREPDHQDYWFIKRLIALPGDPVPPHCLPTGNTDTTVPPGHLIILGDNPPRSYDSRRHGYFNTTDLLGIVIWPRPAAQQPTRNPPRSSVT